MSRHNHIDFYHYPSFENELQHFIDKHTSSDYLAHRTIAETENLLEVHFCQYDQFSKKNFGLAPGVGPYKIYYLKGLVIANSGLTKNQHPKSYLLKVDHKIGFLCLGSHIENYKDEKLRKLALKRAEELFPVLTKI
jgi:hypothetical protein